MSRVVLVRHGEAAAGWGEDADPGLSARGREQARAMADGLEPIGPLPLVVSPLRRCRETAAELERRWGVEALVDPRVGEVETPGLGLVERGEWLRRVLAGSWADAGAGVSGWRREVVAAVAEHAARLGDLVVVTHFVAINVLLGAAADDDRVVVARVDTCSRTVLDVDDGRIAVVEVGAVAATEVL